MVDDPRLGMMTAEAMVAAIDPLVADPGPTFADCAVAEGATRRFNSGTTIVGGDDGT
jgi:hypothetical protein